MAAEGERTIYVVAGDRLLVSKRHVIGEHISHAVLADGGHVQAAGEFEVVEFGDIKVVTSLNDMSGHYRPGRESLDVAMEAFESAGCESWLTVSSSTIGTHHDHRRIGPGPDH